MEPFVLKISESDAARAFSAFEKYPYSLFLDSADPSHPNSRYSYILYNPVVVIEAKDGATTLRDASGEKCVDQTPFTVLEEQLAKFETASLPGLPPFQGGAAGLFGYDLGRTLEELPATAAHSSDIPDMAVGIYDQVIAFDHKKEKAWLIVHADDATDAWLKQKETLAILNSAYAPPVFRPERLNWESNMDPEVYEDAIMRVLDYIQRGEIYQANIAQRFEADLPQDFLPYAHYLRLREVNPAPHAAYFNTGNAVISSASPERFLTVQGQMVETQPIKGTRPRVEAQAMDEAYKAELQNSEKDRAENVMIVDLMRNDISKVCRAHSVKVSKLCDLESFASVHHLVSTINGILEEDKTSIDLLRACFPGGSITGAPKIRAQQIIEELENIRRGPYCGSLGYIGFDGAMDSSILIRTLVFENDKVSLSVGSGIVADSCVDGEYQETFDKADAMFRSFDGLAYEIEDDYLTVMTGTGETVAAE